uniref:Uncharacterized protein n=1 Tax=Sinocyclocheilus anshuiensis TaxID=1608454 RepID=A0A671MN34_9TELE
MTDRQTDSHLQSHVKHHRGDNIEVRESDSESPGEIKEDEQSPAEPFRKHPVRAGHTQH